MKTSNVLHHLANNPFEEFTQQELASLTGADVSSISRSVDLLEKLGVITVGEQHPARITIDMDHLQRPDPVFMIPQSDFRKPVQAYLDALETRIRESEELDELVGAHSPRKRAEKMDSRGQASQRLARR